MNYTLLCSLYCIKIGEGGNRGGLISNLCFKRGGLIESGVLKRRGLKRVITCITISVASTKYVNLYCS